MIKSNRICTNIFIHSMFFCLVSIWRNKKYINITISGKKKLGFLRKIKSTRTPKLSDSLIAAFSLRWPFHLATFEGNKLKWVNCLNHKISHIFNSSKSSSAFHLIFLPYTMVIFSRSALPPFDCDSYINEILISLIFL